MQTILYKMDKQQGHLLFLLELLSLPQEDEHLEVLRTCVPWLSGWGSINLKILNGAFSQVNLVVCLQN